MPLELAIRGLEDSVEEKGLFRVGPSLIHLKKVKMQTQNNLLRHQMIIKSLLSTPVRIVSKFLGFLVKD